MPTEPALKPVLDFLARVPGLDKTMGSGFFPQGSSKDGCWWVKFTIEVSHPLAWNVVQELGRLLNYVSLDEHLPTVFKPVSPPPYLNGGPSESLSWVIESENKDFTPEECAEWLRGRLPDPVDDPMQWDSKTDDEEG